MIYGLTSTGFNPKRLDDIKIEYETFFKSIFGPNINILPSSKFGQLIGILSERESLLWELGEGIYNSQYPLKSSAVQLDNVVSLTGLKRQSGLKSQVTLTFLGDVGTIIPALSIFSVSGNSSARFVLETSQTISAGQDEIQKILFDSVPDSGNFVLSLGGNDSASLAFNATSQDIENALNALPNLSSVLVAGDFSTGFNITFQGADGFQDQPLLSVGTNSLLNGATPVNLTFSTTQIGFPNRVQALVVAENVGAISAPSGSLSVIENPLVGLVSVSNELDATVGRSIESDADLKLRRENSLQTAGASVLGAIASQLASLSLVDAVVAFENITMITDVDGRPPKSFEMVVQGGVDLDIAQKIWETKPAGIETFGTSSALATDSEGVTHLMKFSRPFDVLIYVEFDLTVDVNFPVDGQSQAETAILNFGNALTIGQDVIVFPKLISTLNNIQGILDISIRIGKTASPTLNDNIVIASNEVSKWDSARTLVTIL